MLFRYIYVDICLQYIYFICFMINYISTYIPIYLYTRVGFILNLLEYYVLLYYTIPHKYIRTNRHVVYLYILPEKLNILDWMVNRRICIYLYMQGKTPIHRNKISWTKNFVQRRIDKTFGDSFSHTLWMAVSIFLLMKVYKRSSYSYTKC